jgi:HlyD family secretion protein
MPHDNPAPVPAAGGYQKSRFSGRWIAAALGGVIVLATFGNVLFGRSKGMPDGLVAVNGRFEGDSVIVASKAPGRIRRLATREGDAVASGQILAQLDDAELRARREGLKASLREAEAQARAADLGVTLAHQTNLASTAQAEGVVGQASAGIAAATADLARSTAIVTAAQTDRGIAESTVASLRAQVDAARAGETRAQRAVEAAQGQLRSAEAASHAARASAQSAGASYEQAEREHARYARLTQEGAVAGQVAERAATAAIQARWAADAANKQIEAADAAVETRRAELRSAREQVASATAGIRQAEAQLRVALGQVRAADAGIRQANAQRAAAAEAVRQAGGVKRQAEGQYMLAQANRTQTEINRWTKGRALAQIAAAQAALKEIDATLADMALKSPTQGTVLNRFQDEGELVSAGTPVFEVVDLDRLFLKAYIPETEIGKIHLGMTARVYTDAFPDQWFDAEVGYISQQAEFTPKEIQTAAERVNLVYAVKLYVKSNRQGRITPGMPADAVIRWREDVPWQRPRF